MPEELRRRLVDATTRSGRSINAEIVSRLEASLEQESSDRVRASTTSKRGIVMLRGRTRRRLVAVGLFVLALAAVAAGGLMVGGGQPSATGLPPETEELSPALAARLLANATFAPGSVQEGDRGGDDEFLKLSTPGDTVPAAALQQALADWKKVKGRASGGKSDWKPLGPSDAQGLHVEFRDRSVYTSGTPNFSGRIAHVAIDPNCKANGQCTLWIANANGGVWRTNNALDASPKWEYVSERVRAQQHRVDRARPERHAAPHALRRHGRAERLRQRLRGGRRHLQLEERRQHVGRPARREQFDDRAVGSIAVKPGDSKTIFAASGRGDPRRLQRLLRRRRRAHSRCAALRPLAIASTAEQSWELVQPGRAGAVHGVTPRTRSR